LGQQLALGQAAIEIGRHPSCELFIDSSSVSRRHARVELGDEGYVIRDLSSKNGTVVNGNRVAQHRLAQGDLVKLGKCVLKYVESASFEANFLNELSKMSAADPLTGLANRRTFEEALRAQIAKAEASAQPLSLILIDIDHFKRVNDNFGHPAGDEVVKLVAQALRQQVREVDLVARVGGEEFCILCRDVPQNGAKALAERIRHFVENLEVQFSDKNIRVTISLGVATRSASDDLEAEELYKQADVRLYEAKRAGRNRVVAPSLSPHSA
jgi:diguanylate cyclase (GGDEF)-like protein